MIVVASGVEERELVRGTAGCPVCHAEVRITEGDVWFGEPASAAPLASRTALSADETESLDRLIALLGLAEPEGVVLLMGRYSSFALPIAERTGCSVVTAGAPDGPGAVAGRAASLPVAAVRGSPPCIPFSDATFRAAALDESVAGALAADVVRSVAIGGRVLGTVAVDRPPGIVELARDATEWVGEREAPTPMVSLGRRQSPL